LQNGEKKDGYIEMILEVGFNGIADIIWDEDIRMMNGRLHVG
jgi:hypothetical protein